MAVSLYDLSVKSYLQTLGGMISGLDKGLVHFRENGIDPEEIVGARLHPDMQTLNFQVQAIAKHSVDAISGLKEGNFYGELEVPLRSYGALQKLLLDAQETLRQLSPSDVDGYEGADVVFRFGDFALPFTAENFLLSFSLPNFYFHTTTAYGILRMKGVPLGKIDYLGQMQINNG